MKFNLLPRQHALSALLAAAALASGSQAFGTVYFYEEFPRSFFTNDATPQVTPPPGWVIQNNSSSIGDRSWFGGAPGNFPAFSGFPGEYASVSYRSGAGLADISNWLITPVINVPAGSRVSFVTRTVVPGTTFYPDRLRFRASPTGGANPGTSTTDVGDFTTLLAEINPDLTDQYPQTWTRVQVTLPSAFSGRFAFNYNVTDSGESGINGNTIGIDAFQVADPSEPLPPANPLIQPPVAISAVSGGSLTGTLATPTQIQWYKFNHAGGPITLDTLGSNLTGGSDPDLDNDTELGLFNATGGLVARNDQGFPDGNLSLINLADLTAGTYYLALGGYNVFFGTGFSAESNGTAGNTGTFKINGISLAPSIVKGDFGGNESSNGSFNTPDGSFNELDVEGFLLALNDQAAYLALNPSLSSSLVTMGDFGGNESTNGSFNTPDGAFNELDVEGFLLALNDPVGYAAIQPPGLGGVSAIPEPAALGLLAPMGLLLARRR